MYYVNDNSLVYDNLTSSENGFKKGNIFKDIYSPYKKNIYNFVPKNERQKMLLDILEKCFYAHELNLYLDNYPNDIKKINLFNEYNNKACELKKKYSEKYEPIELNNMKETPIEWVESPWPWEGV